MATSSSFEVILSLKDAEVVKRGLQSVGAEGEALVNKIDQAAKSSTGLQELDKAARDLGASMGSTSSAVGALEGALKGLGTGGLVAAAGLTATAAAFSFATLRAQEAVKYFGELNDQADRLGVSSETFQVWAYGLTQVGVSSAEATTSLTKLNDSVGQIMLHGEEAPKPIIKAFSDLGISIEQVQASGGNLESLLPDIANGMQRLGSTAEQTAVAKQLLGRAGAALVPILKDGAAGLDAMGESARAAGGVLKDDLVKAADDANDALDRLSKIAEVQSARSFGAFASVLVQTKENILEVWKGVNDLLEALARPLPKGLIPDLLAQIAPLTGFVNTLGAITRGLNELGRMVQPIDTSKVLKGLPGAAEPPPITTQEFFPPTGGLPTYLGEVAKPVARPQGMLGYEAPLVKATKARAGRAAPQGKLTDWEMGTFPDSEWLTSADQGWGKLSTIAEEHLTKTQKAADDLQKRIIDSYLQATNQIITIIEKRRDEDLRAIDLMAANEEEKADLRVKVNEMANMKIEEEHKKSQFPTLNMQPGSQQSQWDTTSETLIKFGDQMTSVEGMTQGVISGIASIGATATSAFADAVVAGKGFGDMMDTLSITIEKMMIQLALQLAMQAAIGGMVGGTGASMQPGGMLFSMFGGGAGAGAGGGMGATGTGTMVGGSEWMIARGAAFQQSTSLAPGIYTHPTLFPMSQAGFYPMARGMGLMGEAGPEAVMPLRRNSQGKLGVAAASPNVNVVVNNTSSAQADAQTQQNSNGDTEIIINVVEQRMAERMARPGTTLNRSLGAANNPLRAR